MSCQRINTHQRLYCDKPMRFSSVSFCEGSQTISCYSVLMLARRAVFFWGVWRDMGLPFASFADLFLLNELFNFWTAKACQMIPLSPQNLIFIVRYHHIYIYIYCIYIITSSRRNGKPFYTPGCWSRTKFDVFFFWDLSFVVPRFVFGFWCVRVSGCVFGGISPWLLWISRREVAISWLMAIRSWRIWKQTLRQGPPGMGRCRWNQETPFVFNR